MRPVCILLTGRFYIVQLVRGEDGRGAMILACSRRTQIMGEKKGPAEWQALMAWLAKLLRIKGAGLKAARQAGH